jgi:novobiocin biosynthesis protein NovU/D-mycarose 3-C-methyltransferase
VVIANHVLAHVADPHDFLRGVSTLLAQDGIAVIEVQYLADLLIGNQLDHVYHEHRFHFSLSSLVGLASWHGLHVNDVAHTPAQSGSISIILSRRRGMSTQATRMISSEGWLESPAAYQDMQDRAEHIRFRLLNLVGEELAAGRRLAGYGAPAKATTLLNWCEFGPDVIEYVIDTTPAKVGRFVPGTGIPIVGRKPEMGAAAQYGMFVPDGRELPDTYLLSVWNYLADVLRRERDFLAVHGGRFIVPIPVPVIL